jgi:CBS domain-containing protein
MESSESLRVVDAVSGSRDAQGTCGFLCADLMSTEVAVVGPDDTVATAALKMREQNLGFLPVCTADRQLVGVLTDRDLAVRVLGEQRSFLTPVRTVMSPDPVVCAASAELEVADGLMRAHKKLRIPCIDGEGRLAGVLSLADVARYCDHERAGDLLGEIVGREVPGPNGRSRRSRGPRRTRRAA